ncbi:unnamed protein product [Trichobilharzia regenti]|uniref:Ubiquitin-like domain-containing protein n=1 Tax=Trichobilharzia regenti TaxID=157069 RepID=A0A183WC07_TRIRE|nr:unnamed protein product [Trichobilharzia regenti]VDQ05541.1 unnamed protein product [Trichobilharzia regenti]
MHLHSSVYSVNKKSSEAVDTTHYNKSSQVESNEYFVEIRGMRCNKYVFSMKRYRIIPNLHSKQTVMDISKKLNKKTADVKFTTASIRKDTSNNYYKQQSPVESTLYIQKDGMLFLMISNSIHMDISQSFADYDRLSSEDFSRIDNNNTNITTNAITSSRFTSPKLKIQPPKREISNYASLIGRLGQDIIRIHFILIDCNIKPITCFNSRGCQSVEKYAYIKMWPINSKKPTYCAIPLSTYIYHDPMISVRKYNTMLRRIGSEPGWMIEQRRERHQQFLTSAQFNKTTNNQCNHTSFIHFVMNGYRVKLICSNYLNTIIVNGQTIYKDFVEANQNTSR